MIRPQFETVIIGSGFGGLCMAYNLKQSGHEFVILEKSDQLGGTWRDNTYPGAKCDTPSITYQFTFAPNPEWDFRYSRQAQILEYMSSFAETYDLISHIQFDRAVQSASYDEGNAIWCVQTSSGELTCRYLISSIGQLHHHRLPAIEGMDEFSGPSFHSAQWDHTVDLTDKRVGLIGSAATAIQIIGEVSKIAKHLTVYQRSPNWVLSNYDRPFTDTEKHRARNSPWIRSMMSMFIVWLSEKTLYAAIKGRILPSTLLSWKARKDMKAHIKDTDLQTALTPTFPIGAKRVLFSDDYYPAMAKETVSLKTTAVQRVTKTGIEVVDGQHTDHDVIVYATGFYTNPFLKEISITGRGGKSLSEHWKNGAFAYHTVATTDFPNLFFTYGPNSNTGHSSIIYKLEAQAQYITQLIDQSDSAEIEVKADAEQSFVNEMQTRLTKMVWAQVENSWYKQGDNIPNNWPGSMKEYRNRLARPILSDYNFTK